MTRAGAAALAGMLVALVAATLVDGGGEATPAAGGDRPVAAGATLFAAKGCAGCHQGPDSDAHVEVGPSLRSAAAWAGSRRPGTTAEAYLAESIRVPSAFILPGYEREGGPPRMPDLGVSEEEVTALVGYLLGA